MDEVETISGKELKAKLMGILLTDNELCIGRMPEEIYMIEKSTISFDNTIYPVWKSGYAVWAGEYDFILPNPGYDSVNKYGAEELVNDLFEELDLDVEDDYQINWNSSIGIEIL